LLPELRRAREARAKLKHAILAVSLKKRIAALKTDESDSESSEMGDAEEAVPGPSAASVIPEKKSTLIRDRVKDGAVFREVVLGAVRDKKAKEEAAAAEKELLEEAKKRGQL
jgi:calcium/calmodulin-dependent protein kinase I